MSEPSWNRLWHQIKQDLDDPSNKILSEGRDIHGQQWDEAFDVYLAGNFVQKFWGKGSREIWKMGREDNDFEYVVFCGGGGLTMAD